MRKLQQSRERLANLSQVLESLSPLGTLQRGYAIVTDADGNVLTNAGASKSGDKVKARLAKGQLDLTVDRVTSGE